MSICDSNFAVHVGLRVTGNSDYVPFHERIVSILRRSIKMEKQMVTAACCDKTELCSEFNLIMQISVWSAEDSNLTEQPSGSTRLLHFLQSEIHIQEHINTRT